MTHRITTGLAAAALASTATLAPALAAAEPEALGPHEVTVWEPGFVPAGGLLASTTVYLPADLAIDGAPAPVVLVLHGAARTGAYMATLATTLASRGVIAVVPTLPCTPALCLHEVNATQVADMLAWTLAQGAEAESPLYERVDAERRAVIGHSWGGLAVLLAASHDPTLRSTVLLDPNDDLGAPARVAAADVAVPTAVVRASRFGACNAYWLPDTFGQFTGPKLEMVIEGAGHCDAESPTDPLCAVGCGPGTAETTPVFRRYAVAFTLCALRADADMAPYVGGAALTADEAAMTLSGVRHEGLDTLPCRVAPPAPLPDAGPVPVADALAPPPSGDDALAAAPDKGVLARDAGAPNGDAATDPRRPDAANVNVDADAAAMPFADMGPLGAGGSADASTTASGNAGKTGGGTSACSTAPGRSLGGGALTVLAAALLSVAGRRRRR
jgi:dienelactone hydrolase